MDIGELIGDIVAAPFICIGWLIVGALAGAIAHSIMRSAAPLIGDIILGLFGAVVGGFVVSLLGFYTPETGLSAVLANLFVAIIGAIILIAIGRMIRGRPIT
jgi:uncharacterized membrane protein YeaQ/YmgE (transglycosylase-associated protein family)